VSGAARLYTFTRTEAPTAQVFADEVPQLLAVVELTEGPRLTTTLVETDGKLHIGMAVRPVFEHGADEITLLRYTPV
jgi:uncharacterized OB-fold protein